MLAAAQADGVPDEMQLSSSLASVALALSHAQDAHSSKTQSAGAAFARQHSGATARTMARLGEILGGRTRAPGISARAGR